MAANNTTIERWWFLGHNYFLTESKPELITSDRLTSFDLKLLLNTNICRGIKYSRILYISVSSIFYLLWLWLPIGSYPTTPFSSVENGVVHEVRHLLYRIDPIDRLRSCIRFIYQVYHDWKYFNITSGFSCYHLQWSHLSLNQQVRKVSNCTLLSRTASYCQNFDEFLTLWWSFRNHSSLKLSK